jgi:hypothetical protein
MTRLLLTSAISLVSFIAFADSDINLGGKLTTFTNLQGRVYENVRLERGTLDGVIYSITNGVGGGMVKYKDLSPEFLTDLNIPTNRIQTAQQRDKVRAEQKARYDAAVRALAAKQQEQEALAASNALAQAKANAAATPSDTTDQTATPKARGKKK